MKYLLFFTLLLTFYENSTAQEKLAKDASCYVIVFAEPFEKKEADRLNLPEFQLLDICPKRAAGVVDREAKITITRNGKQIETGFDVVKIFAGRAEAGEFARKYGIADESMLRSDPLPKCKIIRVVGLPLKKRPDAKGTPTLALLDTCLSREARARAHPVIAFEENGRQVSRIFEVAKTFVDQTDAEKYAAENFIKDIEIRDEYKKHVADCRIIRQLELPLSKKPNVPLPLKIALLDTCLNDPIPQQRPVIEVLRNGKKVVREFEVIRIFVDLREAEIYARENGLPDIDLSR
jgi:hypothetical protein